MPDPIDSLSEATGARLDRVDRQISANTQAISELGQKIDRMGEMLGGKIDQLTKAISDQGHAIARLERSIDRLVSGIEAQRATMGDFLSLARLQAQTTSEAVSALREAQKRAA
ncbi:MAG: hypothetical protein AAF921_10090 [Cyanobacteria bacterium P01_D01_bin.44]